MNIAERPLRAEEVAANLRELHEVLKPLLQAQCSILAMAQPTWLLHQDGRIEQVDDGLTAGLREALQRFREMQEEISLLYLQNLARGYLQEKSC